MALTDKVFINNLCSWPLYFKRLDGMGDIRVPSNAKNFAMLSFEEVQMQIQSDNKLFTGCDPTRPGDHARLFIVDDEQRKSLFCLDAETSDDTVVVNSDTVAALLAIKTKKEFNERLGALVKTDAEKKTIVQLAKEVGGDDVASWKMEAINTLAGTTVI